MYGPPPKSVASSESKFIISLGITLNFKDELNPDRGLLYTVLSHIDFDDAPMYDTYYEVIDFLLKHGTHDIDASLEFINDKFPEVQGFDFPDGIRDKISQYLAELNTLLEDQNVQDINEILPTGHARLHYAVLQDNLRQVMSLVYRRASWNLKNRYGESAAQLAFKYNRHDMLQYIRHMVPIYVLDTIRRRNDIRRQERPRYYTRARMRAAQSRESSGLLNLPFEVFQNIRIFFFS